MPKKCLRNCLLSLRHSPLYLFNKFTLGNITVTSQSHKPSKQGTHRATEILLSSSFSLPWVTLLQPFTALTMVPPMSWWWATSILIQGRYMQQQKDLVFVLWVFVPRSGWPDESAQRVVWLSEPAQSNQQQCLAREEQVLQLPFPVLEKCLATQVLHSVDPLRNLARFNLPFRLSLDWKLSRSDFPTTFYLITLPTSGIS